MISPRGGGTRDAFRTTYIQGQLFNFIFGSEENKLNKYGRKLIKLPVPKLVVFYNGRDKMEDETILRLSDSFPEGSTPDIEVKVRMININYGRNQKLLDACEPLKEYSWLMDRIRTYIAEGLETIDAINKAITETPDVFVLKLFLVSHKTEVSGLLLTEYDEAKTMEMFRLDGIEEGIEIGREEGKAIGEIRGVIKLYNDELGLTPTQIIQKIMDRFDLEKEEAEKYVEETLDLQMA